jgi:hypothetical protein
MCNKKLIQIRVSLLSLNVLQDFTELHYEHYVLQGHTDIGLTSYVK